MALRLPVPSDPSLRAVLDRQVQVMFVLAGDVLADVSLDDCLWRTNPRAWTVHERDGQWHGELGEEPPDLPTPSLGWTMWHPVWWLHVLLAHTRGEGVPSVDDVVWPGPTETLPVLHARWSEWTELVAGLDERELESSALTRFPYDDGRPFAYVVGWASMELTKNLAEMCVLRRLPRDLGAT